jgi:hypothetical protein
MRAISRILLTLAIAAAPVAARGQSTPAKADSLKIDVTGKWAFNLETPFPGTPTVTFTQKGDSISGTYTSQVLGTKEFVGTAKAGTVKFSFSAESGGQNFVMSFVGKLDGPDAMAGTIDFSGMADGTFSARRVKPPAL